MLLWSLGFVAAVAAMVLGRRLDDRVERNWALVANHSLTATATALEATR